jgi:hypothetical protein
MWVWRTAMLNKLQYKNGVLRKKNTLRSVIILGLFLPQIQHKIKGNKKIYIYFYNISISHRGKHLFINITDSLCKP